MTGITDERFILIEGARARVEEARKAYVSPRLKARMAQRVTGEFNAAASEAYAHWVLDFYWRIGEAAASARARPPSAVDHQQVPL
jgi:hypothetical protein